MPRTLRGSGSKRLTASRRNPAAIRCRGMGIEFFRVQPSRPVGTHFGQRIVGSRRVRLASAVRSSKTEFREGKAEEMSSFSRLAETTVDEDRLDDGWDTRTAIHRRRAPHGYRIAQADRPRQGRGLLGDLRIGRSRGLQRDGHRQRC